MVFKLLASTTQRLSATLQQRGIHYIDAGTSGGIIAAGKGVLMLMVGGNHQAIQAIE